MEGNVADQPPDEPKFFGDYEVLKWIGRGKFAVVYRARKVGTETMVALKRVSVDLMDEKTREKCLKEVRLLQNLDHKNIIRYLDSFILENDLIIVFEWAAAGDLKRQLRKAIERGSGFDERTIWKYFSQICDAMQHMHERRIMHRDLKPANIFLTLDGTIKVGDLGLSREMSEHTIQAHSKVGTPLYMSPEVLNGEGYDFKSDIWSLGCLLYELASLRSPFKQEGMNLYALCQKIASGDFQPLPDSYSEDLRTLAYSMISTKPVDRPEIGAVCATARRMRAETQAKSTSKKVASTTAVVESQKNSKVSEGLLAAGDRPTMEFDIKPPTANIIANEKEQVPVKWDYDVGSEVENKRSSAKPQVESKHQEDDEQTKNWEGGARDKPRNKRLTEGNRESKRDSPVGQPSEKHFMSFDPSDNNRNGRDSFVSIPVVAPYSTSAALDSEPAPSIGNASRSSSAATARVLRNASAGKRVSGPSSSGDSRPSSRNLDTPSAAAAAPSGPSASSSDSRKKRSLVPAPKSNRVPPPNPNFLLDAAPAFAVMECLYAKLLLLGYSPSSDGFDDLDDDVADTGVRGHQTSSSSLFLPFHFACDLQSFDVAGKDSVQFFQFRRMVCVAVWLAKKLRNNNVDDVVKSIDMTLDTPLVTAKQVLRLVQAAMGLCASLDSVMTSSDLGAVNATSLTSGFGYNVCCVLTLLTDCVLQSQHFTIKPLVYGSEVESSSSSSHLVEGDEIAEEAAIAGKGTASRLTAKKTTAEEEEEEEEEDIDDDNHDVQSISDVYQSSFLSQGAGGAAAVGSMLFGSPIDPVLWKEETERVGRALAARQSSLSGAALVSSEWTGRIQLLKNYSDLTNSEREDAAVSKGRGVSVRELVGSVSQVKGVLSSALTAVVSAEKLLNNQNSESTLRYSSLMKEHSELETRLSAVRSSIEVLSEKLSSTSDSLESISSDLKSRIDGHDGSGVGSSSRIVSLNEALAVIRKEIKEYHISAGVLTARLTALRCQEHASALEKQRGRTNRKKVSK